MNNYSLRNVCEEGWHNIVQCHIIVKSFLMYMANAVSLSSVSSLQCKTIDTGLVNYVVCISFFWYSLCLPKEG